MKYTIDKPYNILIDIKKSKFFAFLLPVESVERVDEILKDFRREHASATHVCYAYVLSSPNHEKCSDDGEPDGTAGKPMLDVLKKNNLTDVLAIVVRYFGGIKLGAGGLVRAYSGATSDVVKTAKLGYTKTQYQYRLTCETSKAKLLLDFLRTNNIKIKSQIYSSHFEVIVCCDDGKVFNSLHDISAELLGEDRVFYDKD